MRHHIAILMCIAVTQLLHAQDDAKPQALLLDRATHGIEYSAETSTTLSSGDHAPFWLTSNRYGLSSIENNSAYLRAGLFRSTNLDSLYRWQLGYGADIAVAANYTSKLIVQQLYADIRYRAVGLSIGAKERPMELKNNQLSTGSQTLGINARPVPVVRLELPDYWKVPYTRGWVQIKGHVAYGMMTDDNWQHSFTHRQSRYADRTLYHSKAGYLRIYNEDYDYPLSFEAGLEMASQFGGTTHMLRNGAMVTLENEKGANAFWHAFIPGGSDSYEKDNAFKNVEGNQLGSWLVRLNYDRRNWRLSVYADHFFEDHSAMFHLDYDGYGQGAAWNQRKERRYLLYGLKDIMLGSELMLKQGTWLRNIVAEYIYTKYQSGPIYHDHGPTISDHIGGNDNYYNHRIYAGWQHWGQVIGNPLFRSPIYNDDGKVEIENSRFMALHLGISGRPLPQLDYRFMGTWQEGLGTYNTPFTKARHQLNLMLETNYDFTVHQLKGWSAGFAIAYDHGGIVGNNIGTMFRIRKTGLFVK